MGNFFSQPINSGRTNDQECFDADFHACITYDIAIECEYTEDIATYIAVQCDDVDIDPTTTPFSVVPSNQSWHFNTLHADNWKNWGTMKDSRWKHAKNSMMEALSAVRKYGATGIKGISSVVFINDPVLTKSFAQGLHALQDMFAHLPDFVYSLQDIDVIIKDIMSEKIKLRDFFHANELPQINKYFSSITQGYTLPENLLGILKAKFHFPNSLADDIDALPSRKDFVEQATALYLRGDLEELKRLITRARGELQEEIQNINTSGCRI